ncbi:ABC transporter ATP-binding protein [Paenibacillus sp. P13VS]|uniref:ABC transporter ATP-binding protein n=1 Tax=Paenibacillus sp. P13VS TaxID=2697367 RepID=UPI00187B4F44|nr:ABC transporter ATP-binding protein [Paenibacillus sp. P13VS]MBE7681561.1 ATP-binding cassette domain-containing protein [Paenibacillus sp. P13VS]
MSNSKQIAISIENVCKAFKIYHDKPLSLKEKILRLRSNNYSDFLAVNKVNLDIKKGETIGLIGHNGCGKSTLLKLITKILYPDQGRIEVNGRISSLIELGAGFHPDFTGRENIYTNAAIFGLSTKEINEKLNDIIEFSELGDFIENPVRTYSSGMYMRLAFSVAINVDPEILLIDEILSVGDTNFQKKCFDKIESFKNNGATIVIVAHDLGTIEKICDRVVWMDKGEIIEIGEPDRVVDLYTQHMNQKFVEQRQEEFNSEHQELRPESTAPSETSDNSEFSEDVRWGSKDVEIIAARILNSQKESTNTVLAGNPLTIEIDYKINVPQKEYIFGIGFYTADKYLVYGNNTEIDKLTINSLSSTGTVRFFVKKCELLSGKYKLNVAVVDKDHRALDFIKFYMDFTVVSNDKSVGVLSIEHEWEI